MRLLRPLAWLLAFLVFASTALADVIHLKTGQKLEGTILSETPTTVTIQTRFGTTSVERSRIEKIEHKRTARQIHDERKAALAADDVNGRFELAMFCKESRLTRQYQALLKEILELVPQHDGANRELGRIQYEGKWYTKEALDEHKARQKQQMEELGMVLHEGKWMTEEELMKAKGFVLVDGQWMPREEADRLKAERDFEEVFGVPLTISDSAHFSVRNTRTDEDNRYLLNICEDAYDHFVALCEPDEKERKFLDYYKTHIYVLDQPGHVTMFIESGYIDRYTPPKNTRERYLDATNFSYYFPQPLIVLSEGRHLKSGGDRETALTGMTLIHLGQMFIRRIKRGAGLPGWAEAGMGHYFEGEFNQQLTVSVIEYPHYEPYVDKWIDGWETFPLWYENLNDPGTLQGLPSLRQLMETPVEELKVDAECKSWSLVSFLLESRRQQFFDFVRESKIKFRGERITSTQAFDAAFEPETMEQVDAAWRSWLRDPKNAAPARQGSPLR